MKHLKNKIKNYLIDNNYRAFSRVKLTTGIVAYHYKNGTIKIKDERQQGCS